MSCKMKTALYFLTLVSWTVSIPADVSKRSPDEFYSSILIPKRVYVEPTFAKQRHRSTRIVGGSEVTPHSVPYHVAVIIDFEILCGGSLISTIAVLTAAHCTNGGSFIHVILGGHEIDTNEPSQVRVTSSHVLIHEKYDHGGFMANDVSIVFLPSPVTLTHAIGTVSLAPADSGSFAGASAFLSGWGMTSDSSNVPSPRLRGVNVDIITNSECGRSFANFILASNLCTSGVGNVGACNGDSGGALVMDGVQVGIVSFGSYVCEASYPTVYARVSSFRSWISEHAGV